MSVTPGTKVELRDGMTYTLRYRTPDLIRLQKQVSHMTGERTSFTAVMAHVGRFDVEVLVAVVWAGLLHAEPELKPETVAERISLDRIDHVTEMATEAVTAAFPKKLRDAADEAAAEQEDADEGNAETAK